jgi:hypothetical protein
MKIRPVGAEMFHAGGQTDMTKLIVTFHNFANSPKKKQRTVRKGKIYYRQGTSHN